MFVFVQALKKNVFLYQDTYYTSSQMKKSCQNTNRNTRNRPQLYSQKWGEKNETFCLNQKLSEQRIKIQDEFI